MFDSRKQNPNCSFGEEIVSYVYDEMKSSEKDEFETHLAECSPCADEIAAFSNVSFSIQEWRNEEFAALETPNIEIPYESEKIAVTTVSTKGKDRSWFDNLGEIFNLSPAFFKTATAFGTLALTIGLAWFFVGSLSGENESMADVKEEIREQKIDSLSPDRTKDENKSLNQEKVDLEQQKTVLDDSNVEPTKVVASHTPKTNSVKTTQNSKIVKPRVNRTKSKTIRRKSKSLPSKKNLNNKPKEENIEIKELPRLTDFAIEESEEKDLKLTDFFDEDESGDE